ncbi:MAG: PKD domain-containing protein [Pseudomonadota bacterium]
MALFLLASLAGALAHAGTDTGLNTDDQYAGPFPIGFEFKFYGKTYTTFYATSNGLLQFSGPTQSYSNACNGIPVNTIAAFWDDLIPNVSGMPTGKIHYETVGVAPHRQLVLQWTNQYFFGTTIPMGTFETVLFEGSDEVKVQYRYLLGGTRSTGDSATIGIRGEGPTDLEHSCNQVDGIRAQQALSFKPGADLSYQLDAAAPYDFIDISGLTPAAPQAAARYVKTAPQWSWTKISDLKSYQIELQTDTGTVVASETLGDVGSYTWSAGYETGKTYLARVRGSTNNGATWELWSALSGPVTVDQSAPVATMLSATQAGANKVQFRFAASDPLSGLETVRLQIATDAAFQTLVYDEANAAHNAGVYDYLVAVAGQRLYARIQSSDRAGNLSPYSNAVDVLVLAPPNANFTASKLTGEAPLEVVFQNTSTGPAVSYAWTFGDGRASAEAAPTIRFAQAGSFEVTLRATGVAGSTEKKVTIVATPDVTKPVLSPITVDGAASGAVLTLDRTRQLTFSVSDAGGVGAVGAVFAGQPVALGNLGAGQYRLTLDPLAYPNGNYSLLITAQDSAGNSSSATLAVSVNLAPPAAPVISSPASGLRTNKKVLNVRGGAAAGDQAQIWLNGQAQSAWVAMVERAFDIPVTLNEGVNQITALVKNNRGSSAASVAVAVTLDTSAPAAPRALNAISQPQGKVRLSWTPSSDAAATGTVVLRLDHPFDDAAQATRLTPVALSATVFDDMPANDGNYTYRVASVNQLGSLSALSNSVQAIADSTAPKAVSIVYQPSGLTDPVSGRIGQGRVDLVMQLSEALQIDPYLSIVPQGGAPIAVALSKTGDLTYNGSFMIDASTPSGVANALFSARDVVGNRGTDIGSGTTLKIDTEGPSLAAIVLSPVAPIKNDTPQTVQATFTFSKAPAAPPQISYRLSGPVRAATPLPSLNKINATTYAASFTLPRDAGLAAPESFSFSFSARDDLNNNSSKVAAFNRFQVYQGNLPPLNVPLAFSAKAQPGGKVKLSWQAVDDASAYQLYRQAPDQASLVPLARAGGVDHIDQTPKDGAYKYAVATVRQSNGQESVSGQSATVDVVASATAPGAPQNLALQLTGQGIYASWQAPLASTVDYYNLYRAGGQSIGSIDGLTPIKTRIKGTVTYDTSPSPLQGAYVVSAVDAAGNESAISNSAYLNASLLPVRNLKVEQLGNALPVISWTAPNGNVAGYLVYVGPDAARTRLTANPISATSLTDTGYSAGERRYTVASVDANRVELARSVLLPNVSAQIAAGLPIKRGVMNKLHIQLTNTSAATLDGVRAVVTLPIDKDASQLKDHKSELVTLAPNQTRLVSVIVGGYADLAGAPLAQVGLEIAPNEGELVRVAKSRAVDVSEGALVVGMATEAFTRGASGKVRLTIENTSEVDVELLTATGNGANDSSELRFKLLDSDGNVLATQPYKQVFGAGVVTLTNGMTVARIGAGASYVSDLFALNVPASSPNGIRVKLEVDKLRYHSGQDDEVQIAGRGSEKQVSLLDTAYSGEVSDVSPLSSFGDEDVIIKGRAFERGTNTALGNTRLKLILNQQGFERSFSVLTDAAGQFSYSFKPTGTDAGLYKVSAVHPDITDRPEQKAFTINRVTVGPTPYQLDVPKNYPFTIPFVAKAGPGTSASGVRLTLDAASQPTGQVPAGINVALAAPVALAERQSLNVPAVFTASAEAQPSGSLIFNVVSNEHNGAPIGQVKVNYTLSEAKPYLVSTPSFVETGMAQGGNQIESLTIENNGLQDALNLVVTLSKEDGGAAPAWAAIASQANGTLPIGNTRSIDLSFTPPGGTPEGVYAFNLTIAGDNIEPQVIKVYASVSQLGKGATLFKVSDLYTATIGKDGRMIMGLAKATVTLQNEDVATISQDLVSDELGEALFQNLPAGRYKFRVRAANHQEVGGRLLIKPGITGSQAVFLDYNLITVEWSVREITIQDRYEVTLNTTFETDVPAAVVVMQPASVNLPKMNVGDVYFGELTLTNFGLVRADNVRQQLPQNDNLFRYEFLVEVPATLESKQRVSIPYRVIALQTLEGAASGANASGGGCVNYSNKTVITCSSKCANGVISTSCGASTVFFAVSQSSCPAGGGGGGGGGGGWGGWGGGGSGGTGGAATSTPLKGQKCQFVPNGGTKGCQ